MTEFKGRLETEEDAPSAEELRYLLRRQRQPSEYGLLDLSEKTLTWTGALARALVSILIQNERSIEAQLKGLTSKPRRTDGDHLPSRRERVDAAILGTLQSSLEECIAQYRTALRDADGKELVEPWMPQTVGRVFGTLFTEELDYLVVLRRKHLSRLRLPLGDEKEFVDSALVLLRSAVAKGNLDLVASRNRVRGALQSNPVWWKKHGVEAVAGAVVAALIGLPITLWVTGLFNRAQKARDERTQLVAELTAPTLQLTQLSRKLVANPQDSILRARVAHLGDSLAVAYEVVLPQVRGLLPELQPEHEATRVHIIRLSRILASWTGRASGNFRPGDTNFEKTVERWARHDSVEMYIRHLQAQAR
jgi:hypothetical protein